MAYFVIKETANQQYMFNLHSANHEIILTSETYKSKDGAVNGVEAVRKNAPNDARYDRRTSGAQHYFVLQSSNNEIVGKSELYTTKQSMENGIAAVKRDAPGAVIKERASG